MTKGRRGDSKFRVTASKEWSGEGTIKQRIRSVLRFECSSLSTVSLRSIDMHTYCMQEVQEVRLSV